MEDQIRRLEAELAQEQAQAGDAAQKIASVESERSSLQATALQLSAQLRRVDEELVYLREEPLRGLLQRRETKHMLSFLLSYLYSHPR